MILECVSCGITEEKVRLFDAVSGKGVVKMCKECSDREDVPLIKKPTTFQLKEAEAKYHSRENIYNRLSTMAGIKDPYEHRKKVGGGENHRKVVLTQQETSLRELVDKSLKKEARESERIPRENLVDNFHWHIMRTRRSKKLTQEQLAREIGEALSTIKMAEEGILPEDDFRLINKLEGFLSIKIRKDTKNTHLSKQLFQEPAKMLVGFNKKSVGNLTIADLQKMKKEGASSGGNNKELEDEDYFDVEPEYDEDSDEEK